MKILHVLAQKPGQTGSGVYFCNLIDRLHFYGHQQRAICARQGEDVLGALEACHCNPVCFNSVELPFPVAGMSDEMPYESTVYGQMDKEMLTAWLAAFKKRLLEERAQFAPDAVILHHLWMLTSLGLEIFSENITLGVCHNTDLRQAQRCPKLRERYVNHLGELSAVATLSCRQHAEIEKWYGINPGKMVAVGGGFDERLFYPAPARPAVEGPEIVFAGKVAPSKGVFALVEAFALAQKAVPGLRLRVVGNATAENEARLTQLTRGLRGVSRQFALPQPQLAALFRNAAIFALPSYYEGLGLSAVEALACGMWCVTSEIEGLQAMLGDEVNQSGAIEYVKLPRLCNTDEPLQEDGPLYVGALAEALIRQAEKALRGEVLPPRVQQIMAGHSWKGVASRFEALLQKLAKS